NLEKRQEAEARMLQLMWERERLSDQKNMASKGNSESISKQAETILYDGATEDDLFRDYWFSQKDPTLERKSNFLTQEEQLHNFRDHNYETLYGDSIIPGPLRDYIHDLPGEYKHKAYEGLGKGIGGLVSGRHPVFKDLGEMIADNIDTYNVAFGRSYRGFLLSGVDEETAKSAARDEAFVVTCLNGIGGVAEDLTEKMSEVFVKDAIPQYLIKKGIKAVKNLSDSAMEEIVAEENENRILSGDSDAGIGGLFERVIIRGLFFEGFNEE
ncbi:MAG: hypothetical protein IJF27_08755, partial [Oscillospiraceae bacterium]|nr:hypothetical protein [Oscillospiraceae bacterium]